MKNVILSGDYKGRVYSSTFKGLYIEDGFFIKKKIYLNKKNVESYEAIDVATGKSMSSGIAKGLIGGAVFGGIGAIAGAASAKNKSVHTVAVYFKDGKKILIDLDDSYMKQLIKDLF